MNSRILVIGGCRSGKSRHALELAEMLSPENRCYVATCVPQDEEMQRRVFRHRQERDLSWYTVEEPFKLAHILREHHASAGVILVDCLTLWLTNWILKESDEDRIIREIEELVETLTYVSCPLIFVSNEVGTGIVPENKLSRKFRDVAGLANQKIAEGVDKVVWMVAGIPVTIKDKSQS